MKLFYTSILGALLLTSACGKVNQNSSEIASATTLNSNDRIPELFGSLGTTGVGGSIQTAQTEEQVLDNDENVVARFPNYDISYFDNAHYFGDGTEAKLSSYVEIHKLIKATGKRSVIKLNLTLGHRSPEVANWFGTDVRFALEKGENIEFVVVAISDAKGSKWDSNFGKNYRIDLK